MNTKQWESFMSKHDLKWNRFPTSWDDCAFLGNGLLGTCIYSQDNHIKIRLGRTDVTETRELIPGNPEGSADIARARLPIGELALHFSGNLESSKSRLSLWNATFDSTINTTEGSVKFSSFISTEPSVIIMELEYHRETMTLKWEPGTPMSPRYFRRPIPATYENPSPIIYEKEGIHYCTQKLSKKAYSTVWKEVALSPTRTRIYITMSYEATTCDSERVARKTLQDAIAMNQEELYANHLTYWHQFYPKSFLSLSDHKLESFYWIQLYKFASGTRQNQLPLDLAGPWTAESSWPALWHNLNIQLCYWPLYTANHLELGESLYRLMDDNMDNLIHNTPEAYQHDSAAICVATGYDLCAPEARGGYCLLTWMCHNYWLHYRHCMDDSLLDNLYPLLKRSVNYMLHQLYKGDDGRYHFPADTSPEYPGKAEDANSNLATLRWGLTTLLSLQDKCPVSEEEAIKWQVTLDNLADYPVDHKGLMIGSNQPYAKSHRHYSHLLGFYPYYILNWEQEENRQLLLQSVTSWLEDDSQFRGYSYTGASSMYASMSDSALAYDYLLKFTNDDKYALLPNTFYKEGSPVIETPFSAVKSMQDLLIQSWGNTLRIFPAVPKEWEDIVLEDNLAEGAFLITAIKQSGKTIYIRITSLAGENSMLLTDIQGDMKCITSEGETLLELHPHKKIPLTLSQGETMVLCDPNIPADTINIRPVTKQFGHNTFGLL